MKERTNRHQARDAQQETIDGPSIDKRSGRWTPTIYSKPPSELFYEIITFASLRISNYLTQAVSQPVFRAIIASFLISSPLQHSIYSFPIIHTVTNIGTIRSTRPHPEVMSPYPNRELMLLPETPQEVSGRSNVRGNGKMGTTLRSGWDTFLNAGNIDDASWECLGAEEQEVDPEKASKFVDS